MPRTAALILALFAGLYLPGAPAWADPLQVITGAAATPGPMSREQVARVFLKQGPLPGNLQQLVPYDRAEAALRARFYQDVAGMSPHRLRAYWAKRVFTGRGRPPETLDADQLAARLAQDPAALSYAPEAQRPAESKALLTLE